MSLLGVFMSEVTVQPVILWWCLMYALTSVLITASMCRPVSHADLPSCHWRLTGPWFPDTNFNKNWSLDDMNLKRNEATGSWHASLRYTLFTCFVQLLVLCKIPPQTFSVIPPCDLNTSETSHSAFDLRKWRIVCITTSQMLAKEQFCGFITELAVKYFDFSFGMFFPAQLPSYGLIIIFIYFIF